MHEITQCVIKRGKEKQYMSVSFALRANLCWKPTSSCYFMDSSHWEWFWWPMRLMGKETLAKNVWSLAWDWLSFHSFSVWFCPFLDQKLAVILTVSYWNKCVMCDLVIVVLNPTIYLTQNHPFIHWVFVAYFRANSFSRPISLCVFTQSSLWAWSWWPMQQTAKETLAKSEWLQALELDYLHYFSVWFCLFLSKKLAGILTDFYYR